MHCIDGANDDDLVMVVSLVMLASIIAIYNWLWVWWAWRDNNRER